MAIECGTCRFFAQGSSCSYCEHPEQKDEGLKKYSYYPFGRNCPLWESGISFTRVQFMRARFKAGQYWPHKTKEEAKKAMEECFAKNGVK